MTVRSASVQPRFSRPRAFALSSTFVLHLAAMLVIAIPIAVPVVKPLPQIVPAVVFETQNPPELLPEPPLPVPPPKVKVLQKPKVGSSVPVAVPTPVTDTVVAIQTPMSTPAVVDSSPSTSIAGTPDTPGGESRTLAYAGALKLRYPPTSMSRREQGTVLLRVLVDADGGVQRIEVQRSSGHSQLDKAARDAVLHAHFRPVLRDGLAVPAWGVVPIEFRLDRT
ncbi:MAG: TonB family protein [Dokdonella sp.]|uniref:energy transducer TonB n=1 Tax=Dokdonella sp. TaxID=2291710 RepID=UPI0032677F06